MKPAEEKQRFALRKLSIGTVSVLVGFLAFGFSASDQVKAATGDDASQNQAVTQVSQQPSQKAAESEIQSSDSTQQSAPAKQQATNILSNNNPLSNQLLLLRSQFLSQFLLIR